MAFIQVPEELLEVNITPAEFRLLVQLINASYGIDKPSGICYWGYKNLASQFNTDKSAVIKQINHLIELGFLERAPRDPKYRAQPLKLTLSHGINRNRRPVGGLGDDSTESLQGCLNDTPKGCLNDTQGCLKDTSGCLKDTSGCLKDTPHKDLKFKYPDLNTQKNACAREEGCLKDTLTNGGEDNQIAPTDVAVGRSMPDGGQAAKSSAGNEEVSAGAAKTKNQILVDDMRAAFTDIFADLSLSMAGNTYILRKKGKYALIEDVRLREVLYWMMRRGLDARILDPNTRVLGETLLEEVA